MKAGFKVREKAVLRELKQVFKRGWKHSRQDKKAVYTAPRRHKKQREEESANESESATKWGQGVREENERKGQGKWKKKKNRCALGATPVLYGFVK